MTIVPGHEPRRALPAAATGSPSAAWARSGRARDEVLDRPGRREDPARRARGRRRLPPAVPRRGPDGGRAAAPRHRRRLRLRRDRSVGRPAAPRLGDGRLPGHGARARRGAVGDPGPRGRARHRPDPRPRRPGRPRAARRARARRHPPRRQARQPHGHPGRPRQGHRLRHRPPARPRAADRHRPGDGDGALPGPRARPGPGGHPAVGRLRPRRRRCTSASPGGARSRATTRSPSRRRTCPSSRRRCRGRSPRTCARSSRAAMEKDPQRRIGRPRRARRRGRSAARGCAAAPGTASRTGHPRVRRRAPTLSGLAARAAGRAGRLLPAPVHAADPAPPGAARRPAAARAPDGTARRRRYDRRGYASGYPQRLPGRHLRAATVPTPRGRPRLRPDGYERAADGSAPGRSATRAPAVVAGAGRRGRSLSAADDRPGRRSWPRWSSAPSSSTLHQAARATRAVRRPSATHAGVTPTSRSSTTPTPTPSKTPPAIVGGTHEHDARRRPGRAPRRRRARHRRPHRPGRAAVALAEQAVPVADADADRERRARRRRPRRPCRPAVGRRSRAGTARSWRAAGAPWVDTGASGTEGSGTT